MTEEERNKSVNHMKRMIREFRIVVAGDKVDVQGGFGRLPKGIDGLPLEKQMDHVEHSINTFHLEGNGIRVGGNYDNGFVLW